MKSTMTIRLDSELLKDTKDLALESNASLNSYIIKILEDNLKRQKNIKRKNIVIGGGIYIHPFKKQMDEIRDLLKNYNINVNELSDEDIILENTNKHNIKDKFIEIEGLESAYNRAKELYLSYLEVKFAFEKSNDIMSKLIIKNSFLDESLVDRWNILYVDNWKALIFLWRNYNDFREKRFKRFRAISLSNYYKLIEEIFNYSGNLYSELVSLSYEEAIICDELDPNRSNGYDKELSKIKTYIKIGEFILTDGSK